MMKKSISTLLILALVILSPGLNCYAALAGMGIDAVPTETGITSLKNAGAIENNEGALVDGPGSNAAIFSDGGFLYKGTVFTGAPDAAVKQAAGAAEFSPAASNVTPETERGTAPAFLASQFIAHDRHDGTAPKTLIDHAKLFLLGRIMHWAQTPNFDNSAAHAKTDLTSAIEENPTHAVVTSDDHVLLHDLNAQPESPTDATESKVGFPGGPYTVRTGLFSNTLVNYSAISADAIQALRVIEEYDGGDSLGNLYGSQLMDKTGFSSQRLWLALTELLRYDPSLIGAPNGVIDQDVENTYVYILPSAQTLIDQIIIPGADEAAVAAARAVQSIPTPVVNPADMTGGSNKGAVNPGVMATLITLGLVGTPILVGPMLGLYSTATANTLLAAFWKVMAGFFAGGLVGGALGMKYGHIHPGLVGGLTGDIPLLRRLLIGGALSGAALAATILWPGALTWAITGVVLGGLFGIAIAPLTWGGSGVALAVTRMFMYGGVGALYGQTAPSWMMAHPIYSVAIAAIISASMLWIWASTPSTQAPAKKNVVATQAIPTDKLATAPAVTTAQQQIPSDWFDRDSLAINTQDTKISDIGELNVAVIDKNKNEIFMIYDFDNVLSIVFANANGDRKSAHIRMDELDPIYAGNLWSLITNVQIPSVLNLDTQKAIESLFNTIKDPDTMAKADKPRFDRGIGVVSTMILASGAAALITGLITYPMMTAGIAGGLLGGFGVGALVALPGLIRWYHKTGGDSGEFVETFAALSGVVGAVAGVTLVGLLGSLVISPAAALTAAAATTAVLGAGVYLIFNHSLLHKSLATITPGAQTQAAMNALAGTASHAQRIARHLSFWRAMSNGYHPLAAVLGFTTPIKAAAVPQNARPQQGNIEVERVRAERAFGITAMVALPLAGIALFAVGQPLLAFGLWGIAGLPVIMDKDFQDVLRFEVFGLPGGVLKSFKDGSASQRIKGLALTVAVVTSLAIIGATVLPPMASLAVVAAGFLVLPTMALLYGKYVYTGNEGDFASGFIAGIGTVIGWAGLIMAGAAALFGAAPAMAAVSLAASPVTHVLAGGLIGGALGFVGLGAIGWWRSQSLLNDGGDDFGFGIFFALMKSLIFGLIGGVVGTLTGSAVAAHMAKSSAQTIAAGAGIAATPTAMSFWNGTSIDNLDGSNSWYDNTTNTTETEQSKIGKAYQLAMSSELGKNIKSVLPYDPPAKVERGISSVSYAVRTTGDDHPADTLGNPSAAAAIIFTELAIRETPIYYLAAKMVAMWARHAEKNNIPESAEKTYVEGSTMVRVFLALTKSTLDNWRGDLDYKVADPKDITDQNPTGTDFDIFRHFVWWSKGLQYSDVKDGPYFTDKIEGAQGSPVIYTTEAGRKTMDARAQNGELGENGQQVAAQGDQQFETFAQNER